MKTILKQLSIFSFAVSMMFGITYLLTGDRFMPFIPSEHFYAVAHTAEEQQRVSGHYVYETYAVNTAGKKQFLAFQTERPLPEGTYVKLYVKGNYIKLIQETTAESIPSTMRNSLH